MASERSTIVLLGAGIQENAWRPVVRALQRSGYPTVASDDQANTALANLVFNLRFWHDHVHSGATTTVPERDLEALHVWTETYDLVKAAISEELEKAEASGELRLRPSFEGVWNALVSRTTFLTIVTTNWDRLLSHVAQSQWSEVSDNSVFHLHGSRENPDLLLLPTELAKEPYRAAALTEELRARKWKIMTHMESANVLVISGLSLSPLDAELAHVLAVGVDHSGVDEILVADPQHAHVCGRLQTLLRHRRPTIRGCHPSSPQELVPYPWPA